MGQFLTYVICLGRHPLQWRHIFRGYSDPPWISFQAPQDEVRHQNLASKYFKSNRSDLPGYFEERVDPSPDHSNSPDFPVGFTLCTRARWSPGRRSCPAV